MKKYCQNCGNEVADEDKFCHKCGKKIEEAQAAGVPPKAPPPSAPPAQNSVRYVQVDTKTGKIAQNPNTKSGSESMMQGMTIAFVAIAVVIVMVAGSMFISGHMSKNVTSNEDAVESEIPVSSEVASEEEPVSSEEEVVSSVPEELQASYLKSKIKGKWSTQLPYKSMSLPVTFTFEDGGKCSCVIKALFITKQFDGNYDIKDGGACTITLNGLEEYMSEGNTLIGHMEFISDNKINFTAGNEIWILNKTE